MPRPKKSKEPGRRDNGLVEVRLLRDHTHGGVRSTAGAVIEVLPRQVEWLRAQGVI